MIDFGLSRFFEPGQRHRTRVGTVYYTAPEVWKQDYDEKCDLWSMGVILYVLICSYPPFDGDDDEDILNTVMKGRYKFHSPEWDGVSDEAKSLIRSLLHRNSRKRPTATQALEHPWFRSQLSDAESESSDEDLDEDAWDDDMRPRGDAGGLPSRGSPAAAATTAATTPPAVAAVRRRAAGARHIGGEFDRAHGEGPHEHIGGGGFGHGRRGGGRNAGLVAEPHATSIATSSFNAAASSSAQRAVEGRRVAGRRSEPVVGSREEAEAAGAGRHQRRRERGR